MGRSPCLKNVDCLTFLFRAKNDGLDPVLRGSSAVRVVKNVWCLSTLIPIMTSFKVRETGSFEIKFKLFPKSLRVGTFQKEVAEGFGMTLAKGAVVVCGKSYLV